MGIRPPSLETVEVNREFWRGRRVLVTGHTGFKGSWLCIWLKALGAEVTGYALKPATDPSLFEAANVAIGMRSTIADVRDLGALRECLAESRAEVIIHMAAQALVLESYVDPVRTYQTNVLGTVNVLEAVRGAPEVRSVVIVSSDKCYENHEWVWGYREIDPMGGRDPYSNSKGCAELVTAAYRQSFFADQQRVGISSARAGNVIGGGDWSPARLIPDLISAFVKGHPALIRHPGAVRPWQHVLDPLSGYLLLAERLYQQPAGYSEGWNFGPADNSAQSVSAIVAKVAELWGKDSSWKTIEGEHLHEAMHLKLDCSKARARLQWNPTLDLPTALEWVVEWYTQFHKGDDMAELSSRQIERYQHRMQS